MSFLVTKHGMSVIQVTALLLQLCKLSNTGNEEQQITPRGLETRKQEVVQCQSWGKENSLKFHHHRPLSPIDAWFFHILTT